MADESNVLGVDESFANIFHGVHKRAFFHRLYQYGIEPQTEQEAEDLMGIGAKIAAAEANPALRNAAAQESRFAKASAALDDALAGAGSGYQPQAGNVSPEAQAAAWELAQDPVIFKSAQVLCEAREQAGEPAAAA